MAYIGARPLIGNYQICDAITASATADYTLQVGSVNVVPESANAMIVSLNSVIQGPGASRGFTVSGSTISFNSALTSSDVIDFIYIFGDVLDIGTPTDGTVTAAKLAADAVTTAKILDANVTTAKILDDNVTTAKIADNNVTLAKIADGTQGDILYYGASGAPTLLGYGTSGDFLKTQGTGANPAWDTVTGGLSEADQWRLNTTKSFTGTTDEVLTANLERTDVIPEGKMGTGMSESSGIFTFPSTGYWWVQFSANFADTSDNIRDIKIAIETTVDDGTYVKHTQTTTYIANTGGTAYVQLPADVLLDVTDVANIKVRFSTITIDFSGALKINGNSTANLTYMTFIKLGDT